MKVLVVFLGGGLGSVLRYLFGKFLNDPISGTPYGTLAANILGSLLIGFILGWAAKQEAISQHTLLLLTTGFCGGFTTFSTFVYENHVFLKSGAFGVLALYTIASFVLAFLAVFLGVLLVRFF